jgi:hypothetical protein
MERPERGRLDAFSEAEAFHIAGEAGFSPGEAFDDGEAGARTPWMRFP